MVTQIVRTPPNTLLRKQTAYASVIRACRSCSAPGVYSASDVIQNGWPNCYDPAREGQPVGNTCPQCGATRPSDEPQGEIWSKEYRTA